MLGIWEGWRWQGVKSLRRGCGPVPGQSQCHPAVCTAAQQEVQVTRRQLVTESAEGAGRVRCEVASIRQGQACPDRPDERRVLRVELQRVQMQAWK